MPADVLQWVNFLVYHPHVNPGINSRHRDRTTTVNDIEPDDINSGVTNKDHNRDTYSTNSDDSSYVTTDNSANSDLSGNDDDPSTSTESEDSNTLLPLPTNQENDIHKLLEEKQRDPDRTSPPMIPAKVPTPTPLHKRKNQRHH